MESSLLSQSKKDLVDPVFTSSLFIMLEKNDLVDPVLTSSVLSPMLEKNEDLSTLLGDPPKEKKLMAC